MIKATLLRLHRWIFLVSAIPLAVIIVTGLILSFQPILQVAGIKPGSITLEKTEGYLAKYDPDGKARALSVDHFEKVLTIGVPEGNFYINLKDDGEAEDDSWISELMYWSRPVHEHLLFGIERSTGIPIVLISTIGMVVGMVIGIFIRWPRIRNTISGWHQATAWTLLPLLILSPLTGVFMALRISFSDAGGGGRAQPAPILDAVRMIAAKHDLSGLHSIRARGGRQLAVLSEGNTRYTYVVSKDGLQDAPSNWPRTFHQGDFAGIWGGVMNVMLSLAFVVLLVTGPWIWLRRRMRVRNRDRTPRGVAVPAE